MVLSASLTQAVKVAGSGKHSKSERNVLHTTRVDRLITQRCREKCIGLVQNNAPRDWRESYERPRVVVQDFVTLPCKAFWALFTIFVTDLSDLLIRQRSGLE